MSKEYDDAIERWRKNRGVGTFNVPYPFDSIVLMKHIVINLLRANKDARILIVTEYLKDKNEIIKCFTENNSDDWDICLSQKLNDRYMVIVDSQYCVEHASNIESTLVIIYKPMYFTFVHSNVLEKAKFKLVMLDRTIDKEAEDNFYHVVPFINAFTQAVVDNHRMSLPVEEVRIGVPVDYDSDSGRKIKRATDEINQTLLIFGDFVSIDKARHGDKTINMSAMQFCYNLAYANGWCETLDMSVEYNKKLDEVYSPTALNARAKSAYDIMRLRSDLVAGYHGKIDEIIDIIDCNKDKKILIINKRYDFANEVRDALNLHAFGTVCQCAHERLGKVDMVDKNGEPVFYTSGAHKGERKQMGAKAQMSLYRTLFNKGDIHVLSVTQAPDKNLNIEVDVVIITSPLCDEIENYVYRLDKVAFREPLKLYTVFCTGTTEEKTLSKRTPKDNHSVFVDNKIAVNYDENSDSIVIG